MAPAIKTIIQMRCPCCGKGEMFQQPGLYNIRNMSKMNATCSNCGLNFNEEPGFYWGAMYVSYGFVVAELIVFVGVLYLLIGFSNLIIFTALLAVLSLAIAPFNFRISRAAYLYLVARMNSKCKDQKVS